MGKHTRTTWHLHVNGLVQGIGFRPHVHIIAKELDLNGTVSNDVDGLHVFFNATPSEAKVFTNMITVQSPPPLAQIASVELNRISNKAYSRFEIIHSDASSNTNLIIPTDLALCQVCRQELKNPTDRRFLYPFNSCSQCGPRFSIIDKLPYDRRNTRMEDFKMCFSCNEEYKNLKDRRYYAQTNSCPKCAIQLSLYNCFDSSNLTNEKNIIERILKLWEAGKIIAIKGIGGFLLTCDAGTESTIQELRRRKNRPSKPLAIMFPNAEALGNYKPGSEALEVLQNHVSPIVLIQRGCEHLVAGVCDHMDHIGVMLPYAPIFEVLLEKYNRPIIATSGNISNAPIIYNNEKAIEELTGIADYILMNDRDIVIPQDDSVIAYSPRAQQKIILRRSRGLAPSFINPDLSFSDQSILSTGAQLKSTFSLLHRGHVYVSQYMGNLDNYDTKLNYEYNIEHLSKLLDFKANLILSDQHLEYISTLYGQKCSDRENIPIRFVQHHIAHFCAILGEHNLMKDKEQVLGVIWDGAGLGTDNCMWGSEFFVYTKNSFTRCCHLSYFDLLLGDKMAKEPRLSALSIGQSNEDVKKLLCQKFTKTEWKLYNQLLENQKHIQSCGMGRLFDAVAAILGILDVQSYEGEAAMRLEVVGRKYFNDNGLDSLDEHYLTNQLTSEQSEKPLNGQLYILSSADLIKHIAIDLVQGRSVNLIAYKFHLTLIKWIELTAKRQNCRKIAFSGGVFQNSLLVDLAILHFQNRFELHFHEQLSPNDENISFGQLIYHQIMSKEVKKD